MTTVTVIDACGRAHVPVLLLSDPGLGKSSLVRGIASHAGVPCETVLGSIREPADVAGLPVVTEALDPPAWAKRLAEAGEGYLFLDELTTCPPAVQAAMLAVALDRTVGTLRPPAGVRVVAGANPADRAADGCTFRWRTASATSSSPRPWTSGWDAGGVVCSPGVACCGWDESRHAAVVRPRGSSAPGPTCCTPSPIRQPPRVVRGPASRGTCSPAHRLTYATTTTRRSRP